MKQKRKAGETITKSASATSLTMFRKQKRSGDVLSENLGTQSKRVKFTQLVNYFDGNKVCCCGKEILKAGNECRICKVDQITERKYPQMRLLRVRVVLDSILLSEVQERKQLTRSSHISVAGHQGLHSLSPTNDIGNKNVIEARKKRQLIKSKNNTRVQSKISVKARVDFRRCRLTNRTEREHKLSLDSESAQQMRVSPRIIKLKKAQVVKKIVVPPSKTDKSQVGRVVRRVKSSTRNVHRLPLMKRRNAVRFKCCVCNKLCKSNVEKIAHELQHESKILILSLDRDEVTRILNNPCEAKVNGEENACPSSDLMSPMKVEITSSTNLKPVEYHNLTEPISDAEEDTVSQEGVPRNMPLSSDSTSPKFDNTESSNINLLESKLEELHSCVTSKLPCNEDKNTSPVDNNNVSIKPSQVLDSTILYSNTESSVAKKLTKVEQDVDCIQNASTVNDITFGSDVSSKVFADDTIERSSDVKCAGVHSSCVQQIGRSVLNDMTLSDTSHKQEVESVKFSSSEVLNKDGNVRSKTYGNKCEGSVESSSSTSDDSFPLSGEVKLNSSNQLSLKTCGTTRTSLLSADPSAETGSNGASAASIETTNNAPENTTSVSVTEPTEQVGSFSKVEKDSHKLLENSTEVRSNSNVGDVSNANESNDESLTEKTAVVCSKKTEVGVCGDDTNTSCELEKDKLMGIGGYETPLVGREESEKCLNTAVKKGSELQVELDHSNGLLVVNMPEGKSSTHQHSTILSPEHKGSDIKSCAIDVRHLPAKVSAPETNSSENEKDKKSSNNLSSDINKCKSVESKHTVEVTLTEQANNVNKCGGITSKDQASAEVLDFAEKRNSSCAMRERENLEIASENTKEKLSPKRVVLMPKSKALLQNDVRNKQLTQDLDGIDNATKEQKARGDGNTSWTPPKSELCNTNKNDLPLSDQGLSSSRLSTACESSSDIPLRTDSTIPQCSTDEVSESSPGLSVLSCTIVPESSGKSEVPVVNTVAVVE